jgi:hypothetical protein
MDKVQNCDSYTPVNSLRNEICEGPTEVRTTKHCVFSPSSDRNERLGAISVEWLFLRASARGKQIYEVVTNILDEFRF